MGLTPQAEEREAMTKHKTATREEWLTARLRLLDEEKAQRRGAATSGAAVGPGRQGVPIRDR